MDDWDSVSNDTPPDSTTGAWDAVSTPQRPPAPARRRLPPDNLAIEGDAFQSANLSGQNISITPPSEKVQSQQDGVVKPPSQPDLGVSALPHRHRSSLPAPSLKRTALFAGIALLLVMSSAGVFYAVNTHLLNSVVPITAPANFPATATADARVTVLANPANATATTQTAATATAVQQIYAQDTSGTPAMSDPLSDDRNSWGIFTTNWGGQCAFTGGAYHLSLKYRGYTIVCVGGAMGVLPNSANFALQVQINVVQGDMGGFYFGDSKSGAYGVLVSSTGTYTLYQYTRSDDKFHYFPSHSNPAIKAGLNQVNVFTVIVNNSHLFLYANAQFITTAYLSAYNQGGGGLIAESPSQPTDVAFSNLKIWGFVSFRRDTQQA